MKYIIKYILVKQTLADLNIIIDRRHLNVTAYNYLEIRSFNLVNQIGIIYLGKSRNF